MITDLAKRPIWKIEDIWIQIAKERAKNIQDGHFKEIEADITPGSDKESKDDSAKFIAKSPYLLMM